VRGDTAAWEARSRLPAAWGCHTAARPNCSSRPPQDHDLPFATWSLTKPADFLVAEGVVDDISHEGLRVPLAGGEVSFQRLKAWKQSHDPNEAKRNRTLHLYGPIDGGADVQDGDPDVVIRMDETVGAGRVVLRVRRRRHRPAGQPRSRSAEVASRARPGQSGAPLTCIRCPRRLAAAGTGSRR
jgi:hypothetical protein